MFNLGNYIDLPLVWGIIIALGIILYVVLDGFDLGIGILFPFAPSDQCRDRMMSSIAPFWDGNETWLILGGGGLFAAFPLAYSIIMSALYLPIIIMLLGLIFRGVAFEFRFKASKKTRWIWDYAFHFGSLIAAFAQGMVLGGFVEGIKVDGRSFAGGSLDWLNAFTVMTGFALVCGHALLGATWLIMKTEDITQAWAKKTASYVLVFVGFFMGMVSLCMPFMNKDITLVWFTMPNFIYLLPIPMMTLYMFYMLWSSIHKGYEVRPFLLSIGIFLMGYLGLGISIWPYIVPFAVTLKEASAAPESQSLLIVGVAVLLPLILSYTAYSYYVFRGKTGHPTSY